MAKLYFRYGAMSSAKTLNLLAVAHNYERQGRRVVVLKPKLDSRFGHASVRSRAGLERQADFLVDETSDLTGWALEDVACVLVDEAHFLNERQIDQLRALTLTAHVPVICYGLRTDFRTRLFPGAKRLMEVADAIEEVKTTCTYCDRKATVNMKHVDGKATLEGPTVDLGAEEKYSAVCFGCYRDHLHLSGFSSLLAGYAPT